MRTIIVGVRAALPLASVLFVAACGGAEATDYSEDGDEIHNIAQEAKLTKEERAARREARRKERQANRECSKRRERKGLCSRGDDDEDDDKQDDDKIDDGSCKPPPRCTERLAKKTGCTFQAPTACPAPFSSPARDIANPPDGALANSREGTDADEVFVGGKLILARGGADQIYARPETRSIDPGSGNEGDIIVMDFNEMLNGSTPSIYSFVSGSEQLHLTNAPALTPVWQFTGKPNEALIIVGFDGGAHTLEIDVDGDKQADIELVVWGGERDSSYNIIENSNLQFSDIYL